MCRHNIFSNVLSYFYETEVTLYVIAARIFATTKNYMSYENRTCERSVISLVISLKASSVSDMTNNFNAK